MRNCRRRFLRTTKLQGVYADLLGEYAGEQAFIFEERVSVKAGSDTKMDTVILKRGITQKEFNDITLKLNEARRYMGEHRQDLVTQALERITINGTPVILTVASELEKHLRGRGAEYGSYTEEQAKEWIKQYKEAMRDVTSD